MISYLELEYLHSLHKSYPPGHRLGHMSVKMTLDVYSRWLPDAGASGVNTLDSLEAGQ